MNGFDPETLAALKKHAAEVQRKLDLAREVMSTPTPMAGQMKDILPEGELEFARIQRMVVTKGDVSLDNLQSIFGGRPDRICPPGTYTRLITRRDLIPAEDNPWCVMMSDTPYEIRSSMEFIKKARGKVLVAGLGLGATLVPVLAKKTVTHVTVLEKNWDVIKLVKPHLTKLPGGEKLCVLNTDARVWKPTKGPYQKVFDRDAVPVRQWKAPYDTVWLDIWPDISVRNLSEMKRMKSRYKRFLKKQGWIGVWEWEYLHQQKKEIDAENAAMFACVGGPLPKEMEAKCVAVEGVGLVRLGD